MNLSDRLPRSSSAFRQLNRGLFGDDPEQADPTPETPTDQSEAELQRECEQWLELMGFRRRTPKEIQAHHKGLWYVHIVEAKRNPILLDLMLIDATRGPYGCRCFEIELKVVGGAMTPEQRCLIARNEGVLCWDVDEFKRAVGEWRKVVTSKQGGNQ